MASVVTTAKMNAETTSITIKDFSTRDGHTNLVRHTKTKAGVFQIRGTFGFFTDIAIPTNKLKGYFLSSLAGLLPFGRGGRGASGLCTISVQLAMDSGLASPSSSGCRDQGRHG
jgi:hypothetical protein